MVIIILLHVFLLVAPSRGRTVLYAIDEELDEDYFLGKVSEDAKLSELMTARDDPSNVLYNINYSGNEDAVWFTINERTSALFTTSSIDRDVICKYSPYCVLDFDVIARSSGSGSFFHKVSVSVTVNDINDNAPKFPFPVLDRIISEASVLGAAIPLMEAEDLDVGNNSIQKYQLLPETVPFSLQAEFYANGRSQLQLIVTGKLDREIQNNYRLKIIARDGGQPMKTGTASLNIIIDDINDNPPKFDKSIYNISIDEDVQPLTTILQLKALDADLGENGRVIYRLSAHQSDKIRGLFKVDPTTGELKVIKSLIEERDVNFEIIVEASDNATNPLISQAQVFLTIRDTQNTPPDILLNILSTGNVLEFFEDVPIGTVLALISVQDIDSGPNGDVTCTINDDSFRLFNYNNGSDYNVILDKSLDREKTTKHDIIITCTDSGTPPLSAIANFSVHVSDSNDNPPRFTQDIYETSVKENNNIGINIGQVQAEDADRTKNISYHIDYVDRLHRWFYIDSENGAIFLNHSLDRESTPIIDLHVIAVDNGAPVLTGRAIFKILVGDVNDNRPVIRSKKLEFWVPENISTNSFIGSLDIIDSDEGFNGKVSVSITNIVPSIHLPFKLFENGSFYISGQLDREITDKYMLSIVAFDHGSPSLNTTVNITVFVEDLNDNNPIIQFPAEDTSFLEISYMKKVNTVIMNIQATDSDLGINARLNYFIEGDNITSDLFVLDSFSGQLSLRRSLTPDDVGVHTFDIIVVDNGSPSRETKKEFSIKISTHASSYQEPVKYYAIAIAIGCVTIVLSFLIILAICFIRRRDRQKCDNSNGSVTSNSTLETDLSNADIRVNGVYCHTYNDITKPVWKAKDKQVSFDDNTMLRAKIAKNHEEVEVVSDDVVIWDWGDTADSYYTQQNQYSSLQRHRQIPNLYGKDQWNSEPDTMI